MSPEEIPSSPPPWVASGGAHTRVPSEAAIPPPPRITPAAGAQFRHRRTRAAGVPAPQRGVQLTPEEMDELYQLLTHNLAQVDEAQGELIMARLVLLLIQELGAMERVYSLIAEASRLEDEH